MEVSRYYYIIMILHEDYAINVVDYINSTNGDAMLTESNSKTCMNQVIVSLQTVMTILLSVFFLYTFDPAWLSMCQ